MHGARFTGSWLPIRTVNVHPYPRRGQWLKRCPQRQRKKSSKNHTSAFSSTSEVSLMQSLSFNLIWYASSTSRAFRFLLFPSISVSKKSWLTLISATQYVLRAITRPATHFSEEFTVRCYPAQEESHTRIIAYNGKSRGPGISRLNAEPKKILVHRLMLREFSWTRHNLKTRLH